MGLTIADLRGARTYLDTNVFIYFAEGYPAFDDRLAALFAAIKSGEVQAVTSELTVAEVLVLPIRTGNDILRHRYERTLSGRGPIAVVPVTRSLLIESARRATLGGKLPDAVHVATAIEQGCSRLLTRDEGVRAPSDIEIVPLDRLSVS